MGKLSPSFFCVCEEDQPCANICQSSSFFAEEDWPWANTHAHLPLLHMGCRNSTACQEVHRCTPGSKAGIRTGEPQAAAVECVHLTACATGLAMSLHLFMQHEGYVIYIPK